MKRIISALLTALFLALSLCVPAMAVIEYGVFYDETEQLGSVELSYMAEHILPQLTQELGVDLRVDAFTDEDVDAGTSVSDIAAYVYENSGYGCGEWKDGVSLTLLLRGTEDGAYTLSEADWCVYAFLDPARGSAQELADAAYEAVEPYMVERAWNGEDMTMSATALSQAVNAMAESVEEYIRANASPDDTGGVTEPDDTGSVTSPDDTGGVTEPDDTGGVTEPDDTGGVTEPDVTETPQTGIAEDPEPDESSMQYILDIAGCLSPDSRAQLEARAEEISTRHGCGVYTVFVDDYTVYGSNDVYKATYKLYHSRQLGLGEERDGVIILMSVQNRKYAMFIYGKNAEYAFDEYGAEQLEKRFLGQFSNNNWYVGVSEYLTACDEYLTLADEGRPVREVPWAVLAIVVIVSFVVAGSVCGVLKMNMKTVRRGAAADEYVTAEGLTLTESSDRFMYTTETRTKIRDDSSSSSGGSTSSNSGGGGHGRSGSF